MPQIRIGWIDIAPGLDVKQPVEIIQVHTNGTATVRGLQLTYLNGQPWLRKGEYARISTEDLEDDGEPQERE